MEGRSFLWLLSVLCRSRARELLEQMVEPFKCMDLCTHTGSGNEVEGESEFCLGTGCVKICHSNPCPCSGYNCVSRPAVILRMFGSAIWREQESLLEDAPDLSCGWRQERTSVSTQSDLSDARDLELRPWPPHDVIQAAGSAVFVSPAWGRVWHLCFCVSASIFFSSRVKLHQMEWWAPTGDDMPVKEHVVQVTSGVVPRSEQISGSHWGE